MMVKCAAGRRSTAPALSARTNRASKAEGCTAGSRFGLARARGIKGPNIDYLANTAAHLTELGIRDPEIEALLPRAKALCP